MSEVIKYNLLMDTVSTTAADVYLNLNSMGTYAASGDVPRYIYTSLTDLCSGFGSLNTIIIDRFGEAKAKNGGLIWIEPDDSMDSGFSDWMQNDESGSETVYYKIMVENTKNSVDFELVRDITFRIRYVLDHELRSLIDNQFMATHTTQGPDLDISSTTDNSINKNGWFKMKWVRSSTPFAAQQTSVFAANLVRTFS